MKYVIAPPGWTCSDRNPFARDGSYGPGWSAWCLLDQDSDQLYTGRCGDGPFSARFGRRVPDLELRLTDFLRYENNHQRTVILAFPEGTNVGDYVALALAPAPPALLVRPSDPQVIVHSTTLQAWEHIQADGALLAASCLGLDRGSAQDSQEPSVISRYYQNEPAEYSEYIMFGTTNSVASEVVLASTQAGRFVLDEHATYEPGVRLYLNNHRIIADGLGTRDGLHLIKVHRKLPLAPYLLAAIAVDDVDPRGETAVWTLGGFVEQANRAFERSRPPRAEHD